MNKTTLEQLYYSELDPFPELKATSEQFKITEREIFRLSKEFQTLLNPKQLEDFKQLENIQSISNEIFGYDCFAYGFNLCSKLLAQNSEQEED